MPQVLSRGTKPCLVDRAVYIQFKQSLSSWWLTYKAQRFQLCIAEKCKNKTTLAPTRICHCQELIQRLGKLGSTSKLILGLPSVKLTKHTGKNQDMSHSHESIKTCGNQLLLPFGLNYFLEKFHLKQVTGDYFGPLWLVLLSFYFFPSCFLAFSFLLAVLPFCLLFLSL